MIAAWINLGETYELVSEYGTRGGALITLDKQIHQRNLRALYEPPIGFKTDAYKFAERRLINLKTA
jgi:hypothetical protein